MRKCPSKSEKYLNVRFQERKMTSQKRVSHGGLLSPLTMEELSYTTPSIIAS